MNRDELRALQAPLKERYQSDPASAVVTLRATGIVDIARIGCRVELPPNDGRHIVAGLHPLAGGDGSLACSGDMLLQALVTCAGTTLAAVATAMELPIRAATITAEGTLDFRGTLGVDRSVPVGFTAVELQFQLDTSASAEQVAKLVQLTERYCVVARSLTAGVAIRLKPAASARG
jgi:uncharacterized OsmC-like protein